MTVTDGAKQQLERLLQPGELLQIGLEGGGCGGATVTLDKVDSKTISESSLPVTGVDNIVWADKTTQTYLQGGVIDYDDGAFNASFVFKPPLGLESCGCGASVKIG